MTNSTHLGLPYLDAAQAQKHVTHNDALRMLDALIQLSVTARNVTSAPAAPAEGGRWLVGSGATGVFAGNANNIAAFQDGVWRFFVPQKGWCAYVETEAIVLVFDGAAWNDIGLSVRTLQNLAELGIGTAADTTNVLAAKLNGALFTAKAASEGGTGDLRYTLNKSAASNTVSQLYQNAFSGRAEVGLTGDDNFHFKVSPNGATWYEALILSNSGGDKFAPAGGFVLGNNSFFNTISASGTVTPVSQVQGTGASAAFLAARFSNDASAPRLFFAKSRGASVGSQGAIASGDDLGGISLAGSDGTAMRHGATLKVVATGAATANGTPAKFVIQTSDGTAPPVDRITIDQLGNLFGSAGGIFGNTSFFTTSSGPGSTTTPTLQVQAPNSAASFLMARFSNDASPGRIFFAKSRGTTLGAVGATSSGDDLGAFFFAGADATAMRHGAVIKAQQTGATTTTSTPSKLEFDTADGTAGATNRMEIGPNGNVGIGVGYSTGTDILSVAGTLAPSADNVYTAGRSGARFAAIWAANGAIQTSDMNDKDLVERMPGAVATAILDAVQPVKFRWKIGGYDDRTEAVAGADGEDAAQIKHTYLARAGKRIHAGFFAQEIKAAMDANGGDFGAWGFEDAGDVSSRQWIRPDQLIPVLWEALRDTRRELAQLKAQVATT